MKLKAIRAIFVMGMISMFLISHAQSSLETKNHQGKVIETMNSGGYTYIQFEENGKKLWVASKQMTVAVGETISFSQAAPMKNFFSRTLNKTFEEILFVGMVNVEGGKNAHGSLGVPDAETMLPKGHKPVKSNNTVKMDITPGSIKKAEQGYTVVELFEKKDSLAGKSVRVRGRIIKYTPGILGKNWIHLRDGSGQEGSNDLTITSSQEAQTGDVILVSGKISYDKKLDAGYHFPVIIEDASFIIEETERLPKGKAK